MDSQEIIETLCKIEDFFSGCRDNANEGSKFKKLFQGYMDAAKGAAQLLKEQEPVLVTVNGMTDHFLGYGPCPSCGIALAKGWVCCPYCGQAVKWE